MKVSDLLPLFARSGDVRALHDLLSRRSCSPIGLEGLGGSSAAVVFAALRHCGLPSRVCLFVLNDEEEAGYFYSDLCALTDDSADVVFFPSGYSRAVKYGRRNASAGILRTEVLSRLSQPLAAPLFVVTFPQALSERVPAGNLMAESTLELSVGDEHDQSLLAARLRELGFHRLDYVYEPGQFAVRGSILDVFSYSSDKPFRIDFFGDEVDSIRTFEVETQLSEKRLERISLVGDVERGEDLVPFTALLPGDTLLVVRNLQLVFDVLSQTYAEGFSRQAELAREAEGDDDGTAEPLVAERLLADASQLMPGLLKLRRIEIGTHASDMPSARLMFSCAPQPAYGKNFDLLATSFSELQADGYSLFVAADSAKQNERLQAILEEKAQGMNAPSDLFTPVERTLHEGFADAALRVGVFTDHQIFDRYHKYTLRNERVRNGKMVLTLADIKQFHVGDFVVHVDHGVGRFGGLIRLPEPGGGFHEVVKIFYKNDDTVYVSIHALHKVSKYRGKDGESPRLNQLGTGAWERLKERTKKRIKDIARDLIKLYSERRDSQGFAFSPDSFMQHELEASFLYEDTPDQLRVTQEVKADMESRQPMDRLVCGDVGFGKTEIAIRAAFKAAADSKQTAVLVPTTVLAFQHFKTFERRLRGFPVRVDYLSRARSAKDTKALLADLETGRIDILVGTHRLISKQVKFRDLGLLVIDEEQKFGVAVKERLRQMKVNVDTLTMSATPIPRTLQFSLMGARDFSTITTPPPNRHPIRTEVHTFSHEVIAEAVNFEMSRGGQTFIVTNRISALSNLETLLRRYVPDARVAVAHGQMPPDKLEQTVLGFIDYDYDVLLSTTIVENGVDIPNANTIIIDAAHTFGLSDLHQMRGRVGRSNRKAFCYLLAPPLSLLPQDTRRRLEAIETFSELGSGINIAMQDLEIRGAGNLLGAEQSGFIADLGYETYQKILAQAVTELKNDEFSELYGTTDADGKLSVSGAEFVDDCNVECDYPAFLPETYVPGPGERIQLYRELDGLQSAAEVEAFRLRLEDRFGTLPPEAEALLSIVPLRSAGRLIGVERILLRGGSMMLYFVRNNQSAFYRSEAFDRVIDYAMQHVRTCRLDERGGLRRMSVAGVASVQTALAVVQTIAAPDSAVRKSSDA